MMSAQMRSTLVETITTWSRLIVAASIITGVVSMILSSATAIIFRLWGPALLTTLGVATSDDMKRVETTVATLVAQVTILARPPRVANYRDMPYAAKGKCVQGEVCAIAVFLERDPRAETCRLIPAEMQFLVEQSAKTFAVPFAVPFSPVNVGVSPRALEVGFEVPLALVPGPARVRIKASYTDCPWQTDGQPPVVEESPPFTVLIE